VNQKSIACALLSVIALAAAAAAQNPRGKAEASLGGKKIAIEYGQPSLKGRDVLAEAPVGTVWRTGADQSTTLTTDADLVIGTTTIPKGSYSLFTKRTGDKTWALVFNKQTGQWGTEHDAKRDLAEVPLREQKPSGPDLFTIQLDPAGSIRLLWGKHVLSTPVKAK
jgi:hypothetical protein